MKSLSIIKKVAHYLYKNGFAVTTMYFPTLLITTLFFKKPSSLEEFLSGAGGEVFFYVVLICHVSWLIYKGIEKIERLSKRKNNE